MIMQCLSSQVKSKDSLLLVDESENFRLLSTCRREVNLILNVSDVTILHTSSTWHNGYQLTNVERI